LNLKTYCVKIDLSYLREMAGDNKELVLEMISIFKSQVVEFGENMDQLLDGKQYDLLGKLAHKAKSSVAIMGLEDLAQRLKDLENSARDGKNIETYANTVTAFKQETAEAVRELNLVTNNMDLYF
jgi:HPt (histidine-containing phosphotransfer) domain-containing protein